jgi:fructose-bisphosphate aldolase class II
LFAKELENKMALVLDRNNVLDVYSEARENKWVIPCFNSENLTTIEAILEAVLKHGERLNKKNLPVIIGITNNYESRPQSVFFTNTRKWEIGLMLFLKNLEVLTSNDSPYKDIRVMIHLDHIQWDIDARLLKWDMSQFSSIMFDASTLPFELNIKNTAEFVETNRDKIVIEGACDEIVNVPNGKNIHLTTPELAEKYFYETAVDIIVANLGTEHRASTSSLKYEGELARAITKKIGPSLCLHGASSIAEDQLSHLFYDGICKVNIWTALERDSSPVLFRKMLENASKIVGPVKAREMQVNGFIGKNVDVESPHSIKYFTSEYRQEIVFKEMQEIVLHYLNLLYK